MFAALLLGCGGLRLYPDGAYPSYPSSFTHGRYAFDALSLPDVPDVDGDGVVDNHLPDVLRLIDTIAPDQGFDPENFDVRLADNITEHSTILVDAEQADLTLQIAFLTATRVDGVLVPCPESYNESGTPTEVVKGVFLDETTIVAGPTTLRIEVVGALNTPTVPLQLSRATVEGTLSSAVMEGRIFAVLPIETTLSDFIIPLLPQDGYDIDGDGVVESVEELIAMLEDLAPSLADVELPYGELGVSVALDYVAHPASWQDP